ncbi:MAG: transglutaminase domain-containing protein [Eubacteriales bacterium]|nr:transglutaminase domain-containing protein [Eubacteriales bacterium]
MKRKPYLCFRAFSGGLCLCLALAVSPVLGTGCAAPAAPALTPHQETEREAAQTAEPETERDGQEDGKQDGQEKAFLYYGYETLDGTERQLYREILTALLELRAEAELSVTDDALVESVFRSVMADHPEIFYADGYQLTTYRLGEEIRRLTFTGTWTMDREQVREREAQLKQAAAEWLQGLPEETDDYGKVKYLYDTLIARTDYVPGSADSQNICSVLLNGSSVCQGYAKTLQYLCQLSGIPALLVTGTMEGEGHAWDLIYMDGDWYHTDPTWGDASYVREGSTEQDGPLPAVSYDYFGVTQEQISRTHRIGEGQRLPDCTAVTDNYYRREGLYLETADFEQIAGIFGRAAERGETAVTFQCAREEVYREVEELLIVRQRVFDCLPGEDTTVAYSDSPERLTFCFWLGEPAS